MCNGSAKYDRGLKDSSNL